MAAPPPFGAPPGAPPPGAPPPGGAQGRATSLRFARRRRAQRAEARWVGWRAVQRLSGAMGVPYGVGLDRSGCKGGAKGCRARSTVLFAQPSRANSRPPGQTVARGTLQPALRQGRANGVRGAMVGRSARWAPEGVAQARRRATEGRTRACCLAAWAEGSAAKRPLRQRPWPGERSNP